MTPPSPPSARELQLRELEPIIGHAFDDLGLLDRALCHASLGNDGRPSYERLEFLGDAVLGFMVADHLYRRSPDVPEGDLTDRRAAVVSRPPLASVARALDLTRYLDFGRGLRSDEIESPRIQADLVEAVLGAIYLDGGVRAARKFVRRQILDRVGTAPTQHTGPRDPKSRLLHLAQTQDLGQPIYTLVNSQGPDHQRVFTVEVSIGNRAWARGTARNKQAAGMAAAEAALVLVKAHLENRDEPNAES